MAEVTKMYELTDEDQTLSLSSARGGGKYVVLTEDEKEHLLGKDLINWCGPCGQYHRGFRVTWEQIETAIEEYNAVPPPSPSKKRTKGSGGRL